MLGKKKSKLPWPKPKPKKSKKGVVVGTVAAFVGIIAGLAKKGPK